MRFSPNLLLILLCAAVLTACGSDSSPNPVKTAFAQRPPSHLEAPVAFRFPDKPGVPVRVYRLPRMEEVTFRFNTTGLAAARVIGYSDDDDQIYLLSPKSTLISLDLGTGRSRTVDSSVAMAVASPTGTPMVVHADGSVGTIEHRVAAPWPAAKLGALPNSILGAGRTTLLVETRTGAKRELLTLSSSRPPLSQEIPEGPAIASRWGDLVLVGSDSGLVGVNPNKIQKPTVLKLKGRPTAMGLSPSSHRIYAALGNELVVFDRFAGEELNREPLPGIASEIRPDPWGRYLLLRPAVGDSAWLFDVAANRYVATIPAVWSGDLPAVASNGSILTRQGSDLVAVAGDSLTTSGKVRGGGTDAWVAVAWDPRRPALQLAEEPEQPAQATNAAIYVQLSMSQNESFAQDLADNLKRSGMNASVLPPTAPDDGYRVVLGPYPTRDAADEAGRKLGKPFWVFSRDQGPATP